MEIGTISNIKYSHFTFKMPQKTILLFFLVTLFILFYGIGLVFSFSVADTDGDKISDYHEQIKYFTDPYNKDTDGDGYEDGYEIINWLHPLHKEKKYCEVDTDNDGLNDELELRFKTSMIAVDTDGDGFTDKEEIDNGYDPTNRDPVLLPKKLVISIKDQTISYYLNNVKLGEFLVSTGAHNSTPKGEFKIGKKRLRAWSSLASLWMPYWMPFIGSMYGIHELPEWPNGYKEGADHLGTPVSHGCVRLGVGAAEFLYNWTPEGTPLFIQ